MATKKKARGTPGQFPSQTYEARKERGRPIVSLSLPEDLVERLRAEAKKSGRTRSAVVEAALEAYLVTGSRRRKPA